MGGKTLFKLLLLLVAAIAFFSLWIWRYASTSGIRNAAVTVVIPSGAGFQSIERVLAEKGVIRPDLRFSILARLLGLTQRLQAGKYAFGPGETPYDVLAALEAGKVVQEPVTIPEGANIYQVADILASGGWVSRERFLELIKDPSFIKELGLKEESLEGYLFPDTYCLRRGQNAEDIIRMMVSRLRDVFSELGVDEKGKTGLSRHEILTLASIVEKETAVPSERPLIAGVFMERLAKGMRLQSDPTVIYGIAGFDGNLTRHDLKTPSSYNTYLIKGLPPGPIANPGRAAIDAVLHPAVGGYLYFVSKNDGTHFFSKSLGEHNRAVLRYQKQKKRN